MDTDSLIVCMKTNYAYANIAKNFETRFDTSNYEFNRTFPNGKNKKNWTNEI